MFYFIKFKLLLFCIEIKIIKKKVEKKIKVFKKQILCYFFFVWIVKDQIYLLCKEGDNQVKLIVDFQRIKEILKKMYGVNV